jgi:hypothetical protein
MSDQRKLTRDEAMELLDAAVAASKEANSKFEPKLVFTQRCEILALHRRGCTREALAKIYGVDRRTVTHIHNERSPRYKNVREEELRLGRDNFLKRYLRADMLVIAADAVQPVVEDKSVNNKKSNAKAGIHTVRNEFCDYDHRIIIQWVEKGEQDHIQVSGWYYKDLDSEWPDQWSSPFGIQDALKTSQACYTAMLADISDKIS